LILVGHEIVDVEHATGDQLFEHAKSRNRLHAA
jgi:hypothetical protein